MFPPQAPWTGLGQLESELRSVKDEVRRKADSHEIHTLSSRLDRLEHTVGEVSASRDRLESELQILRQEIEEIKQAQGKAKP